MKVSILLTLFVSWSVYAMENVDNALLEKYQKYANEGVKLGKDIKVQNSSVFKGYEDLSGILKKSARMPEDVKELATDFYTNTCKNKQKREAFIAIANVLQNEHKLAVNFEGEQNAIIFQGLIANKTITGETEKKAFMASMIALLWAENALVKVNK